MALSSSATAYPPTMQQCTAILSGCRLPVECVPAVERVVSRKGVASTRANQKADALVEALGCGALLISHKAAGVGGTAAEG